MTSELEHTGPSADSFRNVVEAAELQSITLLRFECKRAKALPEHGEVNLVCQLNSQLIESNLLCVEVTASALIDDDEFGRSVSFEADYKVEYALTHLELEADAVELFCRLNAPFNAYPYFRELVDSHSRKMDCPLTLPLWKPSKRSP